MSMRVSAGVSRRTLRFRILLFLFGSILILSALYLSFAISNTLDRLDIVEAERDRWQRPNDVLRALDLREGSNVVDLGSGAGYSL